MTSKSNADRISGAVFLIGVGLLFTPLGNIVGGFFPGILFVVGATAIAKGVAQGEEWHSVTGGIFMIGVGVIFLFGFSLPLLLIGLGLLTLFGYSFSDQFGGKKKRDEFSDFTDSKPKNDNFI